MKNEVPGTNDEGRGPFKFVIRHSFLVLCRRPNNR